MSSACNWKTNESKDTQCGHKHHNKLPTWINVGDGICVAVEVVVEALRIRQVSEEGIVSVEPSRRGIVIPGPQILLADLGVELFAAEKELRQRVRRVEADCLTVSIVSKQLSDSTRNVQQNPSAAVTVKAEPEFRFHPVFDGFLAYPPVSDNVA